MNLGKPSHSHRFDAFAAKSSRVSALSRLSHLLHVRLEMPTFYDAQMCSDLEQKISSIYSSRMQLDADFHGRNLLLAGGIMVPYEPDTSPSKGRAYRAFRVGATGHVEGVQEIEAENDEQAEAIAKRLVDGYDIELWDRDRFIAGFPARPKQS